MNALGADEPLRRIALARDRAYVATAALAFVTSVGATVGLCASMTGGMSMPGGWTMSMAWMKMPGQTWFEAAAMFVGMWVVMMVAMMLPSLVPMLATFRRSIAEREPRLDAMTAIASAGYFWVWTLAGIAVYPIGAALAACEMRWDTVSRWEPLASGAAMFAAAVFQLLPWKARHLRACRAAPACATASYGARGAWKHGVHLGIHCAWCCAGFILVLLVLGVMDLAVMAAVAAAITLERLAPRPERVARALGFVALAAAFVVMARALRTSAIPLLGL